MAYCPMKFSVLRAVSTLVEHYPLLFVAIPMQKQHFNILIASVPLMITRLCEEKKVERNLKEVRSALRRCLQESIISE